MSDRYVLVGSTSTAHAATPAVSCLGASARRRNYISLAIQKLSELDRGEGKIENNKKREKQAGDAPVSAHDAESPASPVEVDSSTSSPPLPPHANVASSLLPTTAPSSSPPIPASTSSSSSLPPPPSPSPRCIELRGMGRAMHLAVEVAEIVKRRVKGIHQITRINTKEIVQTYEPIEEGLKTLDPLDSTDPGYQPPIPESEVTPQRPHETNKENAQRKQNNQKPNKDDGKGDKRNQTRANKQPMVSTAGGRGRSHHVGVNRENATAGDDTSGTTADPCLTESSRGVDSSEKRTLHRHRGGKAHRPQSNRTKPIVTSAQPTPDAHTTQTITIDN